MIEEGGVAVSLYEVEARRIIKIIRKDKSLRTKFRIWFRKYCAKRDTAMPPSVCSIYAGGSSRDAGAGMLFCECSLFLPHHADSA